MASSQITKRKWSGLDNFLCTANPEHCIYDSFDESDVERHIEKFHGSEGPVLARANIHLDQGRGQDQDQGLGEDEDEDN